MKTERSRDEPKALVEVDDVLCNLHPDGPRFTEYLGPEEKWVCPVCFARYDVEVKRIG